MNIRTTVLAILVLLGLTCQAEAATITFEGFFNTSYSAPIVRSGYRIGNVAGDEQHFHEITSTSFGLPNNGTGILLNDRNTRIFVEDENLLDFVLGNVDVGAALNNLPAVGLTIEGFLNGVSTGVITLASLGTGYTTLNGASLGVVDRIVFDGTGGQGGFVMDNLNVNTSVPEPATLLLFGIGLAALAAKRRAVL